MHHLLHSIVTTLFLLLVKYKKKNVIAVKIFRQPLKTSTFFLLNRTLFLDAGLYLKMFYF